MDHLIVRNGRLCFISFLLYFIFLWFYFPAFCGNSYTFECSFFSLFDFLLGRQLAFPLSAFNYASQVSSETWFLSIQTRPCNTAYFVLSSSSANHILKICSCFSVNLEPVFPDIYIFLSFTIPNLYIFPMQLFIHTISPIYTDLFQNILNFNLFADYKGYQNTLD